jgi:hypothetical protein
MSAAARYAQQARQLGGGDAERGPGLEPEQNGLANEVGQRTEIENPSEQT